jgi:hypothetical protein
MRNFDRGIERLDQQRGAFTKNAVVVNEQDMDGRPLSGLRFDDT